MSTIVTKNERVLDALTLVAKKYNLQIDEIEQQQYSTDNASFKQMVLQYALNRVDMVEPNWTFLAAQMLLLDLYEQAASSRGYDQAKNTVISINSFKN